MGGVGGNRSNARRPDTSAPGAIRLEQFDFVVQFCWQPKTPSERHEAKKSSRQTLMDKLKIIFADLKKYQFWVLCGAVLVVSLVCWWLATSGVAGQFQTRKAAINASFAAAVIPPNPPNQTSSTKSTS